MLPEKSTPVTLPLLLSATEMFSSSSTSSGVFEEEGGLGTGLEGHEVEGDQDDLRFEEDLLAGLSKNLSSIDPSGN